MPPYPRYIVIPMKTLKKGDDVSTITWQHFKFFKEYPTNAATRKTFDAKSTFYSWF